MDAYLESLIEPLPTPLGTPTHGPLSGGGHDEPFAAATPMLARLLDAEDALLRQREAIARRATALAEGTRDETRAFLRDAPALELATRGMHAALDDLERRVSHVAGSSAGIGERLRGADAHRSALERARKLTLHLAMFNARRHDGLLGDGDDDSLDVDLDTDSDDDEEEEDETGFGLGLNLDDDTDVVADVFTDPKRHAEAAKLAQILLQLAREHERDVTQADFENDDQRKPSLAIAVENLERYCDGLENRLLEKFERYELKRDVVGMRQCARTVSHFNGGASLIQRFVATRPMFLQVEALTRLDALRDSAPAFGSGLADEKEASDAAETALEALEVFFKETLDEATKEVETARVVFPTSSDAVDQLLRRVVEQRAGAAVDAVAGPTAPPPPVPGPPAPSEGSYFSSFMSPRKAPNPTTARKHRRNVSFGGDVNQPRGGFDLAQAQPPAPPQTEGAVPSKLGHSRSFGMLEGRPGSGEKEGGEKKEGEDKHGTDDETEDTVPPLGERSQPASPSAPKTTHSQVKTAGGHSRSRSYTEYMTPSFLAAKPNAGFYGDPARDEFENSFGVGRDAIVEGTPPGPGHFALTCYVKILAGAVDRARSLGTELAAVAARAGRSVDAAGMCDALFSERREGYGNAEGDALVGLASTSAAAAGATPDSSGGAVPGFDRLIRWHREASERCAIVLSPPPSVLPLVSSEGTALGASNEEGTGYRGNRGTQPSQLESSGSSREDAKVARAVASASALRESVEKELALVETFVSETERLCQLALNSAVDACERRSGRFDKSSDPTEVAKTGVGLVLRAAAACVDAVERARGATRRICDGIQARTNDVATEIQSEIGAGAVEVETNDKFSEAAASLRIARAAAEACRAAVADRHVECVRDTSDAVVAALRKGLKSLMFVVERTLSGTQKRADFKPNEEEMDTWTHFPGQESTAACAAALALVRETYLVAVECLSLDESDVSLEGFDADIRTFAEECALALHKTVTAHTMRFHYTVTGALQLKRDVGEFDVWVKGTCKLHERTSAAARAWRESLDRCNALLIPAHALPELLRETVRLFVFPYWQLD